MIAHPIVAVGAASGGLEPLRRITERLPRNCGAARRRAVTRGP
jgi:chemotaxis response regulator CheB